MSTIKFEHALFIQEHRQEIDIIIDNFRQIAPKVISNTLVQLTNPDLISQFMDAGEFVYNDDITPTSLKLIERCIEDGKEYLKREDFQKCEGAIRSLATLLNKALNK